MLTVVQVVVPTGKLQEYQFKAIKNLSLYTIKKSTPTILVVGVMFYKKVLSLV
jgi:hypothetical protein